MGWEQHAHTRDLQGPIPAKTGKKGQSHECGSAGFVGCCNWKINTGKTWNLCGFRHRFRGSLYLCCECFIYQKKSWNHRQDPKDPLIPWERTLATSPGGTFWNSRIQGAPGYSGIPGFREFLHTPEFQDSGRSGIFWNSRIQGVPGHSGIPRFPGFREILHTLEFQGSGSSWTFWNSRIQGASGQSGIPGCSEHPCPSLWECGSLDSEGSRKTIKAAGDPAASNTKGELKHY